MSLLWLALAPLAVIALARSVRVTVALVVATLLTWSCAALIECLVVIPSDDIFVGLVFLFFFLPFVIAPAGAAVATLLVGPPRHFFPAAASAVCGCIAGIFWGILPAATIPEDLAQCYRDMAAPTILAISTAVTVARLAQRRV